MGRGGGGGRKRRPRKGRRKGPRAREGGGGHREEGGQEREGGKGGGKGGDTQAGGKLGALASCLTYHPSSPSLPIAQIPALVAQSDGEHGKDAERARDAWNRAAWHGVEEHGRMYLVAWLCVLKHSVALHGKAAWKGRSADKRRALQRQRLRNFEGPKSPALQREHGLEQPEAWKRNQRCSGQVEGQRRNHLCKHIKTIRPSRACRNSTRSGAECLLHVIRGKGTRNQIA